MLIVGHGIYVLHNYIRNCKYDKTVVAEYHVIMTVSILESLENSFHRLK